MKLFVVLLVSIGWMQVSAEGDVGISMPDFLARSRRKSSSFNRRNEGDLDFGGELSGSTYVKDMLKKVFEIPEWRDVMVLFASQEELADPIFREKWQISENEVGNNNNDYPEKVRDQLRRLLGSRKWRGLIALSSSKTDLLDLKYREKWGLGPLETRIKYSSESGDFFKGPQWKQFLASTETNKEFPTPQARAKWLRQWILNAMQMLADLK